MKYYAAFHFKEHKDDKYPSLGVSVDRSGDIIAAIVHVPFFDDWVDCTERIQKSEYWREKVAEEFKNYNWDQEEDIGA